MYRILGELRTQYWYWFVRDKLIELELGDCKEPKRRKKLEDLKADSTITHVYSDEKMGLKLEKLSKEQQFDKEFRSNGKHYRNGKRPVPDNIVKMVNQVVPGSLSAYQDGPSGLFLILESSNLVDSMLALARALLAMLESNQEVIKGDPLLADLTEDLSSCIRLSIFGNSIKLLRTIEDIVDRLFTDNDWTKFTSVINVENESLANFDTRMLRQPKYLELEIVAPIAIGFAFFRARFFDEIHYLSKVGYREKYLRFLNKRYLMNEDFWRFDTKAGKKVDITSQCYDDSNVKALFLQAYRVANPVFFSEQAIPISE